MPLALLSPGSPRFGCLAPRLSRWELSPGVWIDLAPRWIQGEGVLSDALHATTRWRPPASDAEPGGVLRTAHLPLDGPIHPLLRAIGAALSDHYGVAFARIGLTRLPAGRGLDAPRAHGDPGLVAWLALGAPRRLVLRPVAGGRSVGLDAGRGTLVVAGGPSHATWASGAAPHLTVSFHAP